MDNHFKIKIRDKYGNSETMTLDLRQPIDIQLGNSIFAGMDKKWAENGNHLIFIASVEHDYELATVQRIADAVLVIFRGNLMWEMSADRPSGELYNGTKAYLYLNMMLDNSK